MPNEKLGHISYFAINMGTTATPLWRQIQNEVEFSISKTSDKSDVSSKSTGIWKKYKKTLLDSTSSVKAYDDLAPTVNFLTYKDINTIFNMTAGTTGGTNGTGLGDGVFECRSFSVTTGEVIETFPAFIDSLSRPMMNMDKVEYTFGLQSVGALTPTIV